MPKAKSTAQVKGHELSEKAKKLRTAIEGKVYRHFAREIGNATKDQIFRAVALVLRDQMAARLPAEKAKVYDDRHVHYLSLEFLLGRSLEKNAYNLGEREDIAAALESIGVNFSDLCEIEPDAGLGNGGLGRLAACYLDAMTTLGLRATGYSICYHYGIFQQKILEGQQIELPDAWMGLGDVWLIPNMGEAEEVKLGGRVEEYWQDDKMMKRVVDCTTVQAVPMDMLVSGYGTKHTNVLRLWDAKSSQTINMEMFSRGEYMKAIEESAQAEVISKILYPEDNHFEGKLLRLRQQYFFVSATIQSICRKHKAEYGTLSNFHIKHVFQINDTHPTLVIPELMRIFLDEEAMDWDTAWRIVTRCVAYTNHTVLAEALECWPQNMFEILLPRIWQIICEANHRYLGMLRERFPNDERKHAMMAIVWGGQVRMANLCVYACFAVNGVSQLHSKILRDQIFNPEFEMWPAKFLNVTNGVDHRRWLPQINPRLHSLICDTIGDAYLKKPLELEELTRHAADTVLQERAADIKRLNKTDFANWLKREQGITVNPDTVFDVQVKRLHEYKRQLLNILNIISVWQELRDNPKAKFVPRTYLIGAKAASGYYMAKQIIRLINSLAAEIDGDETMRDKLKVVFLENYRVSLAEKLMPASEVSQQISLAGKEASGTGNMKFMLNGAITVGTLDGANVEMHGVLGDDNIFIFGMNAAEVDKLRRDGYNPLAFYDRDLKLKRAIDQIAHGFSDGNRYPEIANSLLLGGAGADVYMLCADYDSYRRRQLDIDAAYRDVSRWNKMSLINTAKSGVFAADRAVGQYAKYIWNV